MPTTIHVFKYLVLTGGIVSRTCGIIGAGVNSGFLKSCSMFLNLPLGWGIMLCCIQFSAICNVSFRD